jgi:hypothetical protein
VAAPPAAPPENEEQAASPKKTRAPIKRTRRDPKAAPNSEGDGPWADEEPSSNSAPSGGGGLTLVTTPYAKVYLGKRYLGDTPLFKVSLPAGKHSLKLVDAEGRSLHLPVEIQPGETTALKLALDQIAQD